jgi:hypothetical protein
VSGEEVVESVMLAGGSITWSHQVLHIAAAGRKFSISSAADYISFEYAEEYMKNNSIDWFTYVSFDRD